MRERIRRLEGPATGGGSGVLPFGLAPLDAALLGGGLARAALHVLGGERTAAAGFAAALASRLAGEKGTVLWCRGADDLYGPGLAPFGLAPDRLVVVRPRRTADRLWVLEEGLKSRALAAVLGEVETLPPVAARRLQLAAEAGGTAALLLLPGETAVPAATRWQITPAPGFARPCWRAELRHCRGGTEGGAWTLEWKDGTAGGFALAAGLSDRPADPAVGSPESRRRLAG